MEEYTVALTPQAEQQLRAIVHHIAHELLEPETADALLTALEQAMASLSLLPQRAPLVEEEPWHSQNIRKLLCRNFLIYFWPDPANDVREVFRVLRPGGTFVVCCDSSNPETAKKYTERIHGMKVYTPAELCAFLSGAGFSEVEAHCDPASEMVCVTGRK